MLQIQAIALDNDVSATFQRMCGTEISTAVIHSFSINSTVVTDVITPQTVTYMAEKVTFNQETIRMLIAGIDGSSPELYQNL